MSPPPSPAAARCRRLRPTPVSTSTRGIGIYGLGSPSDAGTASKLARVPVTSSAWLRTLNYVAAVGIGGGEATVLVDTASELTWVQCKPCCQNRKRGAPLRPVLVAGELVSVCRREAGVEGEPLDAPEVQQLVAGPGVRGALQRVVEHCADDHGWVPQAIEEVT
ncbi:hypothetical protein ZWY2020_007755 [Hordeum vulgare]|nr:hypothetical protein ZWY2020_007755 [Hordeum vulgare]